jgi:hypothetical protein
MTFEECELAILRHAVDENEKVVGEKTANTEDIKKIIKILEDFLTRKKCICYGGTAINALLPVNAQFYNKNIEIPDYDFYTPNAINDAKELADIYYKEGYEEVEAKAGVHLGTYKVFVNFIPIADITYINPLIYDRLGKDAITIAGIKYAPINFLRMSLYLELSRPLGDISRWEKVFKRASLLNKYHPLKLLKTCKTVDFQTNLQDIEIPSPKKRSIDLNFVDSDFKNEKNRDNLYYYVRDSFIQQEAVFIGGYASSLYRKYLPPHLKSKSSLLSVPDFDVIIEDSAKCSLILRERLHELGFKNITETVVPPVDEIIPLCHEVYVNKKRVANIFSTIACHNYNKINVGSNVVNVATIDTIMSFYLAFYFSERFIHFRERILCMAKFLFDLEKHNRLKQHGLLKRFTMTCIGKQQTIESIRSEKTEKYKELKFDKNSKEYKKWFFNYRPADEVPDYFQPNAGVSALTKIRAEESPNTSTTTQPKSILKTSFKKGSLSQNDIKVVYDNLDDLPNQRKVETDDIDATNDINKINDKNKQKNKTKKLRFREPLDYSKEKPKPFVKKTQKKRRKQPVKKYVSTWMNRRR